MKEWKADDAWFQTMCRVNTSAQVICAAHMCHSETILAIPYENGMAKQICATCGPRNPSSAAAACDTAV